MRTFPPVLLLALLVAPPAVTAQETLSGCDDAGGGIYADRCRSVAVGMHTARAALGLAAAGGADLPATNSTLGRRIGSTPRLAVAARGTLVRAPIAALDTRYDRDETAWMRGLRLSGAAGVFQGFSVAPTVGGILAVDLLADLTFVSGPSGHAFGDALLGFGGGVRLGVVRESFTLPGVTLTATHRWLGETRYGTFEDDAFRREGNRGAEFETTVTSLRGVVGKDLFAIGFLAGAGWDRYGGGGRIVSSGGTPSSEPAPLLTATADGLTTERLLFFGGVSYNFLVLQLSAEGGWAEGPGGVRSETFGGPGNLPPSEELADLERSTLWGSLALRLTL